MSLHITRHNYDKPHRCTGWSGPAWKGNQEDWCDGKTPTWGEGGSYTRGWQWKVRRTRCCGTFLLPYVLIWFDPYWWRLKISRLLERWSDQ